MQSIDPLIIIVPGSTVHPHHFNGDLFEIYDRTHSKGFKVNKMPLVVSSLLICTHLRMHVAFELCVRV